MSRSHLSSWCLLVVLFSLPSVGCVEGNVQGFIQYDRAKDSFKGLEVYTNLRTPDKKDLDHLVSLHGRRESILIEPIFPVIFSKTAIERKGKHTFLVIDLGTASAPDAKPMTTSIDLEAITVVPGEFFLDEHKHLGYYQEVVVPGKTIDAMLAEVSPDLAAGLAQWAEGQVELSGRAKVRRFTWEDLRKHLLAKLDDKNAPTPEGMEMGPLEEASLKLLVKAGADKTVKLSRSGPTFSTVVPLSKRDCKELIATVDLFKAAVAQRVKDGKHVEPGLPEGLKAVAFRHVEGPGVEVSVDLLELMKAKAVVEAHDLGPEKSKEAEYKKTVAQAEERGLKINKTLSIKDVIAKYVGE